MKEKTVSQSSMFVIQQMMPVDANLAGNIHGGTIMKLIDNTAGIVAIRHCGKVAVTASIDRLDFHYPVHIGDLLRIKASVNFTGRTSIEVGVRVEAEHPLTGDIRHTASAYLTFVALDSDGKPTLVPPAIYETEDEKRRNREAGQRRELRKKILQQESS
jgi:acyl-CoA hydrolase